MDWPIIIGVIIVVGVGGIVVAKWWFKLSSRYYRYEDEPNIHDKDQDTNSAINKPDNEVVIHWDSNSTGNTNTNP